MTPEQYAVSQYALASGLAMYIQQLSKLFITPSLSIREWLDLLKFIFPEVERRYSEAAFLGRKFYDTQRELHHPELPRNDRPLSELKFEWFVRDMEPAHKEMAQEDSPKSAVTKLALTAVREVEMAGRRQIIDAVNNDDAVTEKLKREIAETAGRPADKAAESREVLGWARAATGRETCAWCLMLISRGVEFPGKRRGNQLYIEALSAGLDLDDETALDAWEESGQSLETFREMTEEYIEQWHVGCDCMVVPVFDINDWPGKESAERAMRLWIDAGLEASELIESGKSRTKNVNKETQNALRRRLERGDLSMSNYAIAA